MKFSIFSTFLPISCTFLLLSIGNSAVIENDADAGAIVTVTQKTVIGEYDRVSQENGNVNSRNEIPHIPPTTTFSPNNSENNNSSTSSTSVTTTSTSKTKGRRTKVLEKPIDIQLISQFRELSNNISGISRDSVSREHVPERLPPSQPPSPQQQETSTMKLPPHHQPHQLNSFEKRRGFMRRKVYSNLSPPHPHFFVNNTKREDAIIPEGPELHLSPIEGSLGGFTGLQGLEPLTPVQFIKTLIAVTPFIIPLIFIPLLIFTIGILMIPVTKANVFLDVGELGKRRSGLKSSSFDLLPGFLVNPIKTISSAVATGSKIPRSLAFEIGTKLLDTEECVERLSCEISERYLSYSNWEQGNWRSVVNRSWISRLLSLFGRNSQAVSRIAKSLQSEHDESLAMMSVMNKEKDRYLREKLGRRTSHEVCHRYTCQPRTLLKKFISPASSPSPSTPSSSPSSSLVSFPALVHEEEVKKL